MKKITRIIIAGSRTFSDYAYLEANCDRLFSKFIFKKLVRVLCGMAPGADLLGKKFAEQYGFEVEEVPARWRKYKKAAGPIRNQQMADAADALIVFWDGDSPGTLDMIGKMMYQAASRPVDIHIFTSWSKR